MNKKYGFSQRRKGSKFKTKNIPCGMKINTYKMFLAVVCFILLTCEHNIGKNSNKKFGDGLCIFPVEIDLNEPYFSIEDAWITGKPIISYTDIIRYDISEHVIDLTYSRESLKSKMEYVCGAFVVTLDTNKIYIGCFRSINSSIPSHTTVIILDDIFDSLKQNQIRIKLGYPTESWFKGGDPRSNPRIIERLVRDDKAY